MLPKERWLPDPLLDLEGQDRIRIENYLAIQEFSPSCLKIRVKGMVYEIKGEDLLIRGVTKREIWIEGDIQSLGIQTEENR